MNLYYKIWVDAIVTFKSSPKLGSNWKVYAMSFIIIAQVFNLIAVFIGSSLIFNVWIPNIHITLFPNQKLNAFLSFFLSYFVQLFVMNYLLIFHNHRYEKLIQSYKYCNGKLLLKYFYISLAAGLFVVYVAIFIQ